MFRSSSESAAILSSVTKKSPYLRLSYLFCGIALTLLGIGGLLVHSWWVGGTLGSIGLAALGIAAFPDREAFNRFWSDGAWVDLAELVVQALAFFTS
jgi:hypothetical protein